MQQAELEKLPTQAEKVDALLFYLGTHASMTLEQVKLVGDYISLLRRQAAKAGHQRKTLRALHRVYRATLMENRWLRSELKSYGGSPIWKWFMERAGETLWRQFKKEEKQSVSEK